MLGVKHRWTRTVHEVAPEGGVTLCGYLCEHEDDWEQQQDIDADAVTCKLCKWWQQQRKT